MEYRWRWVPNARFSRWACTFHVVYVNLGTQRKLAFRWNMGLKSRSLSSVTKFVIIVILQTKYWNNLFFYMFHRVITHYKCFCCRARYFDIKHFDGGCPPIQIKMVTWPFLKFDM